MAAPKPRPIVRAEDTKMQHDRLEAEKLAEQQSRQGEISMSSTLFAADKQDGLWDGQSGELLDSGMTEEEQEALARANHLVEDDDGIVEMVEQVKYAPPLPAEGAIGPLGTPIYTPENDPDEIIETVRTAEIVPDPVRVGVGTRNIKTAIPVKRSEPMEIVRLNATCEPTIGKDNHWNFQEGKRYSVPRYVAAHLKEKGLISQWG